MAQVQTLGANCHRWAQAMLEARGLEGTRVLHGLLVLAKRYSSDELERVCASAHKHGGYQLRPLRQLLGQSAAQQPAPDLVDDHPLIRPLSAYAHPVSCFFPKEES